MRFQKHLDTCGRAHTYPDLFENASFLSVLSSRPHGNGVFGHRKRSFSKTLSRVDPFENAVFLVTAVKAQLLLLLLLFCKFDKSRSRRGGVSMKKIKS